MQHINWYPGHMKKTRELIQNSLKLVDIVIEVVDSRIPISSRNPIIDELVKDKERIIFLNKSDLSNGESNSRWIVRFKEQGNIAMAGNSMSGNGIKQLLKQLESIETDRNKDKVRKKPLRIMIVGVPNVGKSSLINRLTGKKSAQTGDRPGVTKGKQWITLKNGMQLLDTPGILWPKFEDRLVGLNLAFCGSIKDEILSVDELGLELIKYLREQYTEELMKRYKLECINNTPLEDMEEIAKKRGFILSGGRIDYDRTGKTVVDEFRSGMIGKITLEDAI